MVEYLYFFVLRKANYIYRIYSINSRAYYSNSSGKIRVREFIRMRVLSVSYTHLTLPTNREV